MKVARICFCFTIAAGLLSSAERATLVVQTGHSNAINAMAFSPDGKILATGSRDTTIKLWDVKTGIQFRTLRGHPQTVSSIVFDPSGRNLLSAGLDGTINIWDIITGESIRMFSQAAAINAIALSPDGKVVASGAWDHTITLWETGTGRQLQILRGHARSVNAVAFNCDGTLIASGSDDNSVRLWSVLSGKEVRTIALKESAPDSDRFVDINTGKPTSAPKGAPPGQPGIVTESVNSVAFSPDGTKLATLSISVRDFDLNGMDLSTKIWDVKTGREIRTLETFSGGGQVSKFVFENRDRNALIGSVSFSPDGTTLIGRGADYKVKVWDVTSGTTLHEFSIITFADDPVKAKQIRERFERITWNFNPHLPTLSPDGKLFAIAVENNISLWDVVAGKPVMPFAGQANSIQSVAFSGDGKLLVAAGPALPTRVWDLTAAKVAVSLDRGSFPSGAISMAINVKQRMIATASPDISGGTATIELWNLDTGKRRLSFSDKTNGDFSIAYSPDGRSLAVGRLGDATSIWDTNTGEKIRELGKTYFHSNTVAFSPDGKIVARTSWGGTTVTVPQSRVSPVTDPEIKEIISGRSETKAKRFIDLWDADTGRQLQRIEGQGNPYYTLAFSSDRELLAAGGEDSKIDLWDVHTGKKVRTLSGRHETFYAVVFSPDGKVIAGGGTNGWIYLWNASSGDEIGMLKGHSGPVRSVAFSPDGSLLASGSDDGTVKLWQLATKEEMATLVSTDRDNYLAATPDDYYTTSRTGVNGVGFRINSRGYPFEQFDLKLNRPDLVLQRLGSAPQPLIEAYHRAHEKRLERMNFTERMLGDDLHLPDIRLVGSQPPISTMTRGLRFRIQATDSQHRLDRLNLYVNDVPVYGSRGINLRDHSTKQLEQDVDVELSDGRNKIQVSVLNQQGIESLKETFNVTYNGPAAQPNLYVLAVGVSHYSTDPSYNLLYADKDARDQIAFWEGLREQFGSVKTKRIINEEATKANILDARHFLSQAGVDDVVVVFFSGHGLLDEKFDYYFGTSDIDFKNPAAKGLPYQAIEGLLDGIVARKKLLLIDTCHAGEIEKDQMQEMVAPQSPPGSQNRGPRLKVRAFAQKQGLSGGQRRIGLSHSVELLQDLFADLRRGSGAQIIGAAGGEEFAEEGDDWGNGVFTYAVLEGLRGQADRNKDGTITVSELRDYVTERVSSLTEGGQRPTAREQNLQLDFPLVTMRNN